jgi:2-polyprenyl-3-methyl-5-hydroxy-6-metoxy-1,4-benzoquinol methylase
VAIDASENNIQVAQGHMMQDPLLHQQIKYIHCDIEDLVGTEDGRFDGVVSSEVLEHVSDVGSFVDSCCKLVKVSHCIATVMTVSKDVMTPCASQNK